MQISTTDDATSVARPVIALWSMSDQLTSITQGSNTTTFTYDALGRRFNRTAGGVTTYFYWGLRGLDLQEYSTGGVTFFGDGLLDVDMWGNGHAEYPCFDWLGSERVVMDSTGQTVQGSISYDAFGQTVATSGSSTNPYMFGATSQYRTDGDAGLMQVGARYYDAQVGRFVTRDIHLDQPPYAYCRHDPVNDVDPTGWWSINIGLSFGLGAIQASWGPGDGWYPHLSGGIGIISPGPSFSISTGDPPIPHQWFNQIEFALIGCGGGGPYGNHDPFINVGLVGGGYGEYYTLY